MSCNSFFCQSSSAPELSVVPTAYYNASKVLDLALRPLHNTTLGSLPFYVWPTSVHISSLPTPLFKVSHLLRLLLVPPLPSISHFLLETDLESYISLYQFNFVVPRTSQGSGQSSKLGCGAQWTMGNEFIPITKPPILGSSTEPF